MRFVSFAEAELAAGRQLPPAVTAAFRRAALDRIPDSHVSAVAKQLTEPVLNVGEKWAEQALAELPGLYASWRQLLRHATTATAAKPSARWEKAGRKLFEETGADAVRGTMLPWLTLVGRPRTLALQIDPNEPDYNQAYDPFNANTLRGIACLCRSCRRTRTSRRLSVRSSRPRWKRSRRLGRATPRSPTQAFSPFPGSITTWPGTNSRGWPRASPTGAPSS